MEVFIPHLKDRNIYLDEIISFSNCNFIFGDINDYKSSYEIVNIQFPEAIFNWIVPSDEQMQNFEKMILLWKKHSKIVFTLNDIESHYDEKNEFIGLFKLLQKHADGVIHLGKYSLEKYKHLFSSNCRHTVINHPLYESLIKDFKTEDFQSKFQLNFQDKYIVSVIGCIRSIEEVKLIFEIFNKIPIKNKFLIVPNMFQFVKMPSFFPYRFRNIYKKVAEKIFCYPLHKDQYFFGYKFMDYSYIVDLVKKSSLIVIPRIKNLNSGNVFLGLTFDKPMIIPGVGNLTEVADFFGFPVLNLEQKNYNKVISNVIDSKFNRIFISEEYISKKELYHPKKISESYEAFFKSIIE